MNASARSIALAAALATISACGTTTSGVKPILTADGPSADVLDAKKGVENKFKAAEDKAANAGSSEIGASAKAMMDAGFALIYANCHDYFASAGKAQKWIYFSRDVVGAVGTIATGIMALHGASENAVANVGFATGATYAGLDIYTKNFLFSAENIDSVRELVLKALVVHSDAVPTGNDTYETATLALLDNQNICTPMAITALVREAIKKGDVVPSNTGDPLQVFVKAQDQAVLAELGKALSPPGALKIEQATGLWWLLRGQTTPEQRQNIILPLFKDFAADKNPIDTSDPKFVYKKDWPSYLQVNALLGTFSATAQASIQENIAKAEQAPASTTTTASTPQTESASPTSTTTPSVLKAAPSLLAPRKATTRRVSVGIR